MMKEKPNRKDLRKKNYDYRTPGSYFVTFHTSFAANWVNGGWEGELGVLTASGMKLNTAGEIVYSVWKVLPSHYVNVKLGEMVIMPNHVHALINLVSIDGVLPKYALSEVIRGWKTYSAKEINRKNTVTKTTFWQRSFYDKILKDKNEVDIVRKYIENNANKHYKQKPVKA